MSDHIYTGTEVDGKKKEGEREIVDFHTIVNQLAKFIKETSNLLFLLLKSSSFS